MTDKELLELAAKASGVVLLGDAFEGAGLDIWCGFMADVGVSRGVVWNPLDDDGDALRLARDCRVQLLESMALVDTDEHYVQIDFDPQATLEEVRRAIVRAAAEVGKAMP